MALSAATGTIIGGGLGALGNVLGGWFGAKGQESANAANLQIAREQMAFQERMSGTAYQRAAKDLKAAGLNRVLALGNSASTPPGASATMQNTGAAKQAAAIQIGNIASATALNYATANLKDKQAKALGGAAAVGEGAGDTINKVKDAVTDTSDKSPLAGIRLFVTDMIEKGVDLYKSHNTKNRSSAKGSSQIGPIEMMEMNYAGLNFQNPKGATLKTIDFVRKNMDIPSNQMTDREIAQWIIDNPEKVKRATDRWRKQNLN